MSIPKKHPPKTPETFPGYPPYPSGEDITQNSQRVSLRNLHRPEDEAAKSTANKTINPENLDEQNSSTDISSEEQSLLDAAFQNRRRARPDLEEPLLDATDSYGEVLNESHPPYNLEGADLDVPGSEADDADEAIGEEDEENNFYSLGQDSLPEHESDEDL